MTDLPPGWVWTTLGEIADTALGKMLDRGKSDGHPHVPYLRNVNVQWGHLDLTDVNTMELSAERHEEFALREGDLLVCEGGDVGRCAIYRAGSDYMAFQKALHRVRPRAGVVAHYLQYLLEHYRGTGTFKPFVTGSTIKHLPQTQLRRLPVPLPPLAEQHRIVSELEVGISHIQHGDTTLATVATRIRRLWNSTLGVIHDEATATGSRVLLGDVCEVRAGIQKQPKRRPTENSCPFLRVANVPRGRLDLSEVHQIELFDGELERYRIRYGDLLVVEGNGSSDQIGRAALWRGEISDCVHQNHLIRVRPGPMLDPDYLELMWNSPVTAKIVQDVASSSSGLHTLSVSKLNLIPMLVPTLSVQRGLVMKSSDARIQLDVLRKAVVVSQSRSRSLRKSLLTEAIGGRLVPQDPEDESASVLLDRIRGQRDNIEPTARKRRAPAPSASRPNRGGAGGE